MSEFISSIFNNQITGLPKDSEEFAEVIMAAYAMSKNADLDSIDNGMNPDYVLRRLRQYESESYGIARSHLYNLREGLEKALGRPGKTLGNDNGGVSFQDFRKRGDYVASLFPNEESGD
jgi:hypothetical protein